MNQSISKPLNQSIKQSIQPYQPTNLRPDRASVNQVYSQPEIQQQVIQQKPQQGPSKKKFKIITGIGICLMIFGLLMFLLFPPLIHSQIVSQAIDQAILTPDNQNFWAHFPGDSKTVITRNYSFFNFTNEQQFFLYGAKPKFRQVEGYIIQQLQDYFDIKYSEDQAFVSMKDWLRFEVHQDSRSLQEKFKIVNLPALGYWYILKNSRDQLLFIQGFSLLFRSIEDSIVDTVIGQGIASQYLTDQNTANMELFKPSGISSTISDLLWNDDAYGFSDKNNIKFWVQAAKSSFNQQNQGFSESALDLKDYFTLTDLEMYYLLAEINQYSESLVDLIFDNHYCLGIAECDGKQLAIRQIAQSYVTYKTPPVSSITPTYTICTDNVTCQGYFPQIYAFYKQVYLKQYPEADPFLTFDVQMVRKWVDYNPSRKPGQYNKNQSALLHIGNLDALFGNGTQHDKKKKDHFDTTDQLINIMQRFDLPGQQDARVFWQWIKYIVAQVLKQGTNTNQILGIANSFSSAIYDSFTYLQDHLQNRLLTEMIIVQLYGKNCNTFIAQSFDDKSSKAITNICNNYSSNIQSKQFVQDSIRICRNKDGKQWNKFQSLGATNLDLVSYCDQHTNGGFGAVYDKVRSNINQFYQCDKTHQSRYCSDYQLALIQWGNSTVTLKQPPNVEHIFKKSTTFSDWDSKATAFQYSHYRSKFPDKYFPAITIQKAYNLFNFDNIFSATSNVKTFRNSKTHQTWKDYIRYITVFYGLKGLTNQKSARQYIFGYNDEYLLWRKNNYPPFGGDPSTPAYTAFNDLNISKQEVTIELTWHTGKANSTMTGQHYTINGKTYLTTNYTKFNGNETYWLLDNPWQDIDYFYGTSGKQFSPDQPNSKNISIYVPNLQRYGSGSLNQSYPYERYGYDLSIAYLGKYIYQPAQDYPDNEKYYQHFFGVFNQTSINGVPLFMTKHHFMNCTSNWSSFITIYNEDESIQYINTSHWDDSYVIVEPYSGVSFQSTLYLQGNYYYEPDQLFKYNTTLMLPVFSIYRSGNLTEQQANVLFGPLTTALNVKTASFYVGIVLTLIGLGVIVFGVLNIKKINRRNEQGTVKKSIKISMQEQKKKQSSNNLLKPLIKQKEQKQISYKQQASFDEQPPKSLSDAV